MKYQMLEFFENIFSNEMKWKSALAINMRRLKILAQADKISINICSSLSVVYTYANLMIIIKIKFLFETRFSYVVTFKAHQFWSLWHQSFKWHIRSKIRKSRYTHTQIKSL